MFLSSQHQTSAVETEDTAHIFDLLNLFLCMYLLLPCQSCACFESLVEVHQWMLDLRATTYTRTCHV